jgi:RNA polymerase sigma-70 factor (ECF subfamily)
MEPNQAYFQTLFEKSKDDVFRLIRARVGTREDSVDILQDVYVDLWIALKKGSFVYRSDPELLGFLYLIARRKVARFYRFRKVTISLDDIDLGEENKTEAGETALLLQGIKKLNNLDQEVVRLRYFSGLSFKEIADLLDKGESAIKTRHHRAIMKLKEILGYEKES